MALPRAISSSRGLQLAIHIRPGSWRRRVAGSAIRAQYSGDILGIDHFPNSTRRHIQGKMMGTRQPGRCTYLAHPQLPHLRHRRWLARADDFEFGEQHTNQVYWPLGPGQAPSLRAVSPRHCESRFIGTKQSRLGGNRDCHASLTMTKPKGAMTAASPWVETARNGRIPMQMEVENGKDSLDI